MRDLGHSGNQVVFFHMQFLFFPVRGQPPGASRGGGEAHPGDPPGSAGGLGRLLVRDTALRQGGGGRADRMQPSHRA